MWEEKPPPSLSLVQVSRVKPCCDHGGLGFTLGHLVGTRVGSQGRELEKSPGVVPLPLPGYPESLLFVNSLKTLVSIYPEKKGCYPVSTPISTLGLDHRQGGGHLATRFCDEQKQKNVFLRGHISRMSHMAPVLMFQLLESGLPLWVFLISGGSCVPMNWNLQKQMAKRTPQKSPALFSVKNTSF